MIKSRLIILMITVICTISICGCSNNINNDSGSNTSASSINNKDNKDNNVSNDDQSVQNDDTSTIKEFPKSGDTYSLLDYDPNNNNQSSYSILFDDSYLYYIPCTTNYGNNIYRMKFDGTGEEKLTDFHDGYCLHLCKLGTNIYFSNGSFIYNIDTNKPESFDASQNIYTDSINNKFEKYSSSGESCGVNRIFNIMAFGDHIIYATQSHIGDYYSAEIKHDLNIVSYNVVTKKAVLLFSEEVNDDLVYDEKSPVSFSTYGNNICALYNSALYTIDKDQLDSDSAKLEKKTYLGNNGTFVNFTPDGIIYTVTENGKTQLMYYQFNKPDETIIIADGDEVGLQRIDSRNFFVYENNIITFKTADNNKSKKHPDYNICCFMNLDFKEEHINDITLVGEDHYSNMDVFGKNKDKFYVVDKIIENGVYKNALVISDFNGNVKSIELK